MVVFRDQELWLDREFAGRLDGSCCVLGGGPSVSLEAVQALGATRVIATNVAVFSESLAPVRSRFVAGIILDESLLIGNLRRIIQSVDCPVFTGNSQHDNHGVMMLLRSVNIHKIPSNYTDGFGDTFGEFGNGGNTGFAAVQLAYLLGFRRVGLLGFDGAVENRGLNFHDSYGRENEESRRRFAAGCCEKLSRYAAMFEALDLDVVNLSGISRLAGFRRMELGAWSAYQEQPIERRNRDETGSRTCGSVVLPYSSVPEDREIDYDLKNRCFGGAVNAAVGGRYSPVPKKLMSDKPASGR